MSDIINKIKSAFNSKDIEATKQLHAQKKHIPEPWHKTEQGKYIGSAVYGASDGIITTFAVVAGAAGANLSTGVILILGFANLLGDGFSMATGDYLSEKSEADYIKSEREREEWEVEVNPVGERHEIREIYSNKGLAGEKLDKIVEIITSDKKIWVDTMMREELGLSDAEDGSPLKSALITFFSFIAAGFMPLLAYVFASYIPFFQQNLFASATFITALTLFVVGAARTYVTDIKWYKSGLEMLIVGSLSAGVAYFVGYFVKTFFGITV